MIKIAPSILSADFSRLGEEIKNVLDSGADYIHFDVMDGNFVPNISIGLPVLKSVRAFTGAVLDVHLMIDRPIRYIQRFLDAGADILNIHAEASSEDETHKALDLIRSSGKIPALTLKPATSADAVLPFIEKTGLILIMTVEPGFGGQRFMHNMLPKIEAVRAYIDSLNPGCELEVDGGIDEDTAKLCVKAGANVLVAGSAVFGVSDRTAKIAGLRTCS